MTVQGVPAAYIRAAGLEGYLAEFTDGGHVTVPTLLAEIETRDRQCWTVKDGTEIRAVALTRIAGGEYPICEITHLTGSGLREWQDAFNEIEQWARSIGCTRIKALARPGYERVGRRYGLKKTHVLLEKEL